MDSATAIRGSFRDPSGFVFSRNGVVYRQVAECYAADYEHLMSSGLFDHLVGQGWLLAHEELDLRLAIGPCAYKVLRPAQLAFVSHPYEWCFSQLKEAALTTLRIQQAALDYGMSLKDASAFNIQLHKARSTLIDTLSFEKYQPGRPWVAYRQFCQHFLAPLALMSTLDIRLGQFSRIHIDGIPLDLASRLLPFRTRFKLGLGLHLHAHARIQKQFAGEKAGSKLSKRGISLRALRSLVSHLEQVISGLKPGRQRSEWEDYYRCNNNYNEQSLVSKVARVRELLQLHPHDTVWDLGANDGRFSRLARQCGAQTVVAWDVDPNCVESNYQSVISNREPGHFPLILDLTNPSPGTGWANHERASFADRGPADVVLALGLIHHLAISNNVPLARIARYLRSLGRQVLVEWVPKEDSQVQKLLATRCDVFPGYQQSAFQDEFSHDFQVLRQVPVEGSCRTLYLFQAHPGSCRTSTNAIPG